MPTKGVLRAAEGCRGDHGERMPLRLNDRAVTTSPLPLLTSREARVRGIPVSAPRFIRVRRGVYADADAVAALRPWERYALRVHAYALVDPDAALAFESAAVLHGLPLFGEPRDIHVHDAERTASRRFGDVAVHTSVDSRRTVVIDGITATSLVDTVADLARVLPPAQSLAVVDAATSPVQGGTLRIDALRDLVARQANGRGRRLTRWVLGAADPRAESVGESISRAVIEWSGFERPDLQAVFRYEGAHDRTDFLFRSARTVGESDGWGKYDFGDPDAAQRHLRAEKRREDRLRRHGHPFARWDLSDAMRVGPLCRALGAASVPLVASPDRAALATLRRSPRSR